MKGADGGLFLTPPQILARLFSLKFLVTAERGIADTHHLNTTQIKRLKPGNGHESN